MIRAEVTINDRIEAQVHKGMTHGRDLVTHQELRAPVRNPTREGQG